MLIQSNHHGGFPSRHGDSPKMMETGRSPRNGWELRLHDFGRPQISGVGQVSYEIVLMKLLKVSHFQRLTIPQWLTIQWMGLESVQMRAVGEIYWVYIVGILHDLSTPDHQWYCGSYQLVGRCWISLVMESHIWIARWLLIFCQLTVKHNLGCI